MSGEEPAPPEDKPDDDCVDMSTKCPEWAERDMCETICLDCGQPDWYHATCPKSCGQCGSGSLVEAMSDEEARFRMSYTCQEMQDTWEVCTKEDDVNHALIMEKCPFTCAQARGEAAVGSGSGSPQHPYLDPSLKQRQVRLSGLLRHRSGKPEIVVEVGTVVELIFESGRYAVLLDDGEVVEVLPKRIEAIVTHPCANEPEPESMNAFWGAPKGCAGAVRWDGPTDEGYCKGGDGKYPWWARCCMWDDGANKCQKKYIEAAPASCTDTTGWDNGWGFGCVGPSSYTSEGWCARGAALPGQEWTLGPTYNYPEKNCCVCGKGGPP
jgi:hypothetical protein